MEKLRDLSFEEMQKVEGGRFGRWVRLIYDALQIQDAINEFADGWNSYDCSCQK